MAEEFNPEIDVTNVKIARLTPKPYQLLATAPAGSYQHDSARNRSQVSVHNPVIEPGQQLPGNATDMAIAATGMPPTSGFTLLDHDPILNTYVFIAGRVPESGDAAPVVEPDLGRLTVEYDDPDFGAGYDVLAFRHKANSALGSLEVTDSGQGSDIAYVLRIAEDEQTLSKEISSSVESSANILGAEVGGSASLLNKVDMKASTLSLIARMNVSTGGKRVARDSVTLKAGLDDLMREKPADFYRAYGTHFIFAAEQGAEVTVVLSKDYQSIGEKTQAAVSAHAKYGPVSGSASFKMDIESFSRDEDTRLDGYQTGWLGPVPSMDSKAIIQYVTGFADLVKKSPNPKTYTVTLAPYSEFASPAASKAFDECIRPVIITVGRFVAALNAYADARDDIEWASEIGLGTQSDLDAWAAEITRAHNVLQDIWIENRGTLSLPSIESVYKDKGLNPPEYYQAKINKIIEGKPVLSGDYIYLRYSDNRMVTAQQNAYQGRVATWEYTPTLGVKGPEGEVGVKLQVVGPVAGAAIRPGQSVQILTTEASVGDYKVLSAFQDTTLYYYQPGWGNNQQWTVARFDQTSRPICYGDQLVLTNVGWNQQLVGWGDWLSTTPSGSHFWYFDPV